MIPHSEAIEAKEFLSASGSKPGEVDLLWGLFERKLSNELQWSFTRIYPQTLFDSYFVLILLLSQLTERARADETQ